MVEGVHQSSASCRTTSRATRTRLRREPTLHRPTFGRTAVHASSLAHVVTIVLRVAAGPRRLIASYIPTAHPAPHRDLRRQEPLGAAAPVVLRFTRLDTRPGSSSSTQRLLRVQQAVDLRRGSARRLSLVSLEFSTTHWRDCTDIRSARKSSPLQVWQRVRLPALTIVGAARELVLIVASSSAPTRMRRRSRTRPSLTRSSAPQAAQRTPRCQRTSTRGVALRRSTPTSSTLRRSS
ncbi:hypothetical protein EXIGLDRAFT_474995 [Exidia glandulosa HHB12029]|uniref:Uncharacterized protein n=1 Tax=Exidia glandulosa HHB12029 TaxID=1314781 RepID=A0A165JWM1_EXIGL|nr:hypothetical protein EXIGLDRAFT_474995 [Exidia glandulosa HHB12029]